MSSVASSSNTQSPSGPSFATINYLDDSKGHNLFEFDGPDLATYPNFSGAKEFYEQFTLAAFRSMIAEHPAIEEYLSVFLTTLEGKDSMTVLNLVREGHIHWGGDNQTGERPNAINNSATVSEAFTPDQVFEYYTGEITKYDDKLQAEADKYLAGNINLVKCGLMVYDLLFNHLYDMFDLHTVRADQRLTTDAEIRKFQFNKFKKIFSSVNDYTYVAVQESIDFDNVFTSCMCFRTRALPSNKKVISGNHGVSLIVDKDLACNTTNLDNPDWVSSHDNLKKTSAFSTSYYDGSRGLIVVLHLKNPKTKALDVSTTLLGLIQHHKDTAEQSGSPYDFVVVLGDTNLDKKYKFLPNDMAEALRMNKVSNTNVTTWKQRTWAQGQVEKIDEESVHEKDAIFFSGLSEVSHSVFPSFDGGYLPNPDWPSDHAAVMVKFSCAGTLTNI